MLKDGELENSVEPRREEPGCVAQFISERRRYHFVHHLALNDLHLSQRHLRDAIHCADELELRGEAFGYEVLLRKDEVLFAYVFVFCRVILQKVTGNAQLAVKGEKLELIETYVFLWSDDHGSDEHQSPSPFVIKGNQFSDYVLEVHVREVVIHEGGV